MTSGRPPWALAAPTIRQVAEAYRTTPTNIAALDHVQAYVRDQLDSVGLSVHDEHTLYVVISTAGLFAHLVWKRHLGGGCTSEALAAAIQAGQVLTAALIEYLPDEVRP